jgi:hypothetical protein
MITGSAAVIKITPSLLSFAILLATGLDVAPAQAMNTQSWVSADGLDTNDCSRPKPCHTFAFAITQTNAGGEINVLDPGAYGAVTITKSISIVNDGAGPAGIVVPAGSTGITISAGSADVINLRGLIIEGAGVGANGIVFHTGKSLTIANCVVRHLLGVGLVFQPNASSTLAVSDSYVADNAIGAINVTPTGSGSVKAAFNRVEIYDGSNIGLSVDGTSSTGTINAAMTDSVAGNNVGAGIFVLSSAGHAPTRLMLVRSVSLNNGNGIVVAGTNAIARLAQSAISGNTTGWFATGGGFLQSYGDNYIDGNVGGETAPPSIAKK